MSNQWGQTLQLSIFGESHGKAIGVIISGIPAGIEYDKKYIQSFMDRRRPGFSKHATKRKEEDAFEILSGVFNNRTSGSPICAIIHNQDTKSSDYDPQIFRPSHADYTAHIKYKGFQDYRGSGHFSGRLTACLCFAGALAKYILEKNNIIVASAIKQIGNIKARELTDEEFLDTAKKNIPIYEKEKELLMELEKILAEQDSCGGVIDARAFFPPKGLGDPFFHSLESHISSLLFSVPAVKGVEFGSGFALASMKGSDANDTMRYENDDIVFDSNHNGGILGGISTGQTIQLKTVIKPTPSIGKKQTTVNVDEKKTIEHSIEGRHDPCIVFRALPVIESVLALSVLDLALKEHLLKFNEGE